MTKLIDALLALAESRPVFDWHNYGDYRMYNRERARATRQLGAVRRAASRAYAAGVTDDDIRRAAKDVWSGRVHIGDDGTVDYCAGQYYPLEYRSAICAVLDEAADLAARRNHEAA